MPGPAAKTPPVRKVDPADPSLGQVSAQTPVAPTPVVTDTRYATVSNSVETTTSTIRKEELLLNERTLVSKDAILNTINL